MAGGARGTPAAAVPGAVPPVTPVPPCASRPVALWPPVLADIWRRASPRYSYWRRGPQHQVRPGGVAPGAEARAQWSWPLPVPAWFPTWCGEVAHDHLQSVLSGGAKRGETERSVAPWEPGSADDPRSG